MTIRQDYNDAVRYHFDYLLDEVDALKSYFDEGDEESLPDRSWAKLDEIENELRKLRRSIAKEYQW